MSSTSRISTLLAAIATSGLLLTACSSNGASAPTGDNSPTPSSAWAVPEFKSSNGELDVTLTASESQVPYQGGTRWAMTYNGQATGPTLRVHPGDRLTVTLVNDLAEPTSLHTHGLHVSPEQDNPFAMVEPGQSSTITYDIPKTQQAGTYWYHPHVHELTAEQVASGLSGAIIVEDDTDAALASVSTDRVLVITDPPLTERNPWRGATAAADSAAGEMGDMQGMGDMGGHDMSGHDMGAMMGGGSGVDMMTAMMGRTGPRLLTNGTDGVALADSGGKLERVHVVNATASTSLTLTFTGASMLAFSSPGGRLQAPRKAPSVDLSPGQRTELVLVPSADGGKLFAQRHTNEGEAGLIGIPEVIATVSPDAGTDVSALPKQFTANTRDLFASDVVVDRQRVITLDGHMNPTIDGVPFDPNTVNITAKKGTVEEWVIRSNSPMVHPIHLHTWPFQVKGEAGWDDVVSVPAGSERVIRIAFDDFGGTTVLHCHVLDHEDAGMMAVVKVE